MARTEQDWAIEELAECVKELVRILQFFDINLDESARLEVVYKKATKAKNRMP